MFLDRTTNGMHIHLKGELSETINIIVIHSHLYLAEVFDLRNRSCICYTRYQLAEDSLHYNFYEKEIVTDIYFAFMLLLVWI